MVRERQGAHFHTVLRGNEDPLADLNAVQARVQLGPLRIKADRLRVDLRGDRASARTERPQVIVVANVEVFPLVADDGALATFRIADDQRTVADVRNLVEHLPSPEAVVVQVGPLAGRFAGGFETVSVFDKTTVA